MKIIIKEQKKIRVKLFTDPDYYGAEIEDNADVGLSTITIDISKLSGFEPDEKMNDPESSKKVMKMVKDIKNGKTLPPILARKKGRNFQVLDGHHRYHAAKIAGLKQIQAKIIPDSDIEIIGK